MSEFVQYLTEIFGIKEFELFDSYTWNNAEFLSYLLDRQIDYKNGKVLDMSQLHKDILIAYDFTRKEKRMFIEEEIEKIEKFLAFSAIFCYNNTIKIQQGDLL